MRGTCSFSICGFLALSLTWMRKWSTAQTAPQIIQRVKLRTRKVNYKRRLQWFSLFSTLSHQHITTSARVKVQSGKLSHRISICLLLQFELSCLMRHSGTHLFSSRILWHLESPSQLEKKTKNFIWKKYIFSHSPAWLRQRHLLKFGINRIKMTQPKRPLLSFALCWIPNCIFWD